MPASLRMRIFARFVLTLTALLAVAPPASRAFVIAAHSEHYDAASETFQFSVTFSGLPDLLTVNAYNAEADAIQYWITWETHPTEPLVPWIAPDVIIRCSEIRTFGQIPIRDRTGDGGPGSGGWGAIRGMVPYLLAGPTLSFEVPRAMLGDSDGVISYFLMMLVYGGATDGRAGVSDQPDLVPAARTTWGRIKSLPR